MKIETLRPKHPVVFEEFFELGLQESASPFLKPQDRLWSINLTLKASILAACLLVAAFAFSFVPSYQALSNLLLLLVYFLAGIPSLIEAIEDLGELDINIDILMTLAAFSSVLIGSGMEGALLLVLFALSGAMEDAVNFKAKGAISSLNRLSPTKACIIESDGKLIERSVHDINVGATILVKSGQVVPLDGTVIAGASSVNLVHLTGENIPITKIIGDEVPAGARNLEGTLTLTVTHTSGDSTLAKIIELVTQAQEARPRLQRLFDKASRTYALTIIALAFCFALTLPFFLSIPFLGIEGSIYRALAFLIAASPCALIIAIPIAYLSALSACAKRGILLKGGIILDALASCRAIAFDKTGTLTKGELVFENIKSLYPAPWKEEEALAVAYALEKNAVHPIAKAVIDDFQRKQLAPVQLVDFKAIPGQGLEGIVLLQGKKVAVSIGRPEFILTKVAPDQVKDLNLQCQKALQQGFLIATLLIGTVPYLLQFRDDLRPGIRETVEVLHKKRKMQIVMLTGDHIANAQKIAAETGIKEVHAELQPEGKLHFVGLLAEKQGLAMVGDGINDAPALARATVGICMGKVGSTPAIDAADVVLLQDNIELLDWLLSKAKMTQHIVRQNLALAILAIALAAIPALAGVVPLWLAVVMHEGGTVLVGLNGLRLLRQ